MWFLPFCHAKGEGAAMAIRYLVKKDVFIVDRSGHSRFYSASKRNPDGTVGYLPDDLKGLTRDHVDMFFEKVEMSGASIVEQATQAPGEKRARKSTTEES